MTSRGFDVFTNSPVQLAAAGLFVLLLLVACVSDVRTRRIPNELSAVLAVAGLLFSIGADPFVKGLLHGAGGLALGLALWLPSYAFRLLGAGDVKLFAAAGAWLGPMRTLEAALIGALVGGVLALLWMVWSRGMKGTAVTLWVARVSPSSLVQPRAGSVRGQLPYSVALSLGLAIAAWLPRHIF